MIVIYKDDDANAIFVENQNGAQFLNNLQAVQDNITDSTLSIMDMSKGIELMSDIEYTEFVDDAALAWGTDGQTTTNNLNAIFQVAGNGGGNIPVITSSLAVAMTQGDTLNYELTATDGVGYEWDLSTVGGVVNVEGNVRKIIGGSNLLSNTYNIPVKAINYFGEDSETIVLTVSAPPFSNTKCVDFVNQDYLNASATTSNPLYRAANGTGASDAWTIAFWMKRETAGNNSEQTIISFGGSDQGNEGRVQVWYDGNNSNERIELRYGTDNNYIQFKTPITTVPANIWFHVILTYDGGTTGQDQGQLNDYYSRFEIWIDGVSQTLTTTNNNDGWSGSIKDDFFRVARNCSSGNYLRRARLDEIAIWGSDQTANVASIYNSGATHDLSLLSTPPSHWWRMGDGDTFPILQDQIASLDFTMVNMTVSDIINDVP